MYAMVPTTLASVLAPERGPADRPKSMITTRPSCVTSTFRGLDVAVHAAVQVEHM